MEMGERLLRLPETLHRMAIGKTNLDENFVKTGRLRKIRLGPRAYAFTESNVQEVIAELITESENDSSIKAPMPAPNKNKRRAGKKVVVR